MAIWSPYLSIPSVTKRVGLNSVWARSSCRSSSAHEARGGRHGASIMWETKPNGDAPALPAIPLPGLNL
ncbi:hypothetical protein CTRI78_v003885 [Colletotrichum trifolii]|uniref:Uncharacterized protein n=1 Tax=Colletotrichum trifolii TaxID=5466 RepID=A0A4R8RIT3_COLTR|nr:hypothetical protein CTRI78_v003885 [Colletotrichum trifolii]